jgi:AhpC/TSA family
MSLPLGSDAPAFALRDVGGSERSLASYADATLLALIQSCNHCPYVRAWEGRMIALQGAYGERGVRFVALNSNDASRFPEDGFDEMVVHAAEQGFNFDYLHDPEQSLARGLGSERTPEIFLFGRDRRLVYHGAIDDNRDDSAVQRHYLQEALEATLADEAPSIAETAAVGCTVKWLR